MSNPVRIAAAYIRVSTEDQTEYSPAAQLRELQEYASAHHLILDERYIYSDEGISGRKAEKRPGFMRMISDAKCPAHPFHVILVHKFDRFARSREDSVVYKSILKRCGVDVISIKEPLSEGNYSGVMEAIYESFAEAYSLNLGQEVKKGMTEKARRGEVQSCPPFGYRLENHIFVPHEIEAPLVRALFIRFVSGESYFGLAKWLNTQHITTHRGSAFENRTVEYILHNPVYIGKLRWNPSGRTCRNYNDPNLMIINASHQPLIDLSTWEKAQTRAAELKSRQRYHSRPPSERKHWLSGIVRCAACGATLIWSSPHYFKCSHYAKGRCRQSQHIAADTLTEAFLFRLREDTQFSSKLSFRTLRSKSSSENQLQQLQQKLNRIATKEARLTDAYLNAALTLDEFHTLKSNLQLEADALRSEVATIETIRPHEDTTAFLRSTIAQTLHTLHSDISSIEEKHNAANALVEHCTFDKSTRTLTIIYRPSLSS